MKANFIRLREILQTEVSAYHLFAKKLINVCMFVIIDVTISYAIDVSTNIVSWTMECNSGG